MTQPADMPPAAGLRQATPAMSIALLLLRLALAALFAFAASMKLFVPPADQPAADPAQLFAFSVDAFGMLAKHLVPLATFTIPWTELLIALCLVLGLWTRAAALLLSALLAVFIIGIVSVLERHLSVSCGCFGDKFKGFCAPTLGWCNVVQNTVLLAMSMLLVFTGAGRFALEARLSPSPPGRGPG